MPEKLYNVQEGDWLGSIGRKCGIPWKKIYDHPKNKAFKEKYPDPNVINPGEELWIPEPEWVEVLPKRLNPEPKKLIVKRFAKEKIEIVFKDEKGNPLANEPYRFKIGGYEKEGITDDDGKMTEEIEPKYLEYGTYSLTIKGRKVICKTGHLDTMEQTKGIQARLMNLGYDVGPLDGIIGPKTKSAIIAFQKDHGMKEEGIADLKTKNKLKEIYGS